jgi:hypothetical protein
LEVGHNYDFESGFQSLSVYNCEIDQLKMCVDAGHVEEAAGHNVVKEEVVIGEVAEKSSAGPSAVKVETEFEIDGERNEAVVMGAAVGEYGSAAMKKMIHRLCASQALDQGGHR